MPHFTQTPLLAVGPLVLLLVLCGRAATAEERPGGIPGAVWAQLELLDAPDWPLRERASEWLVAHADAWARTMPADWSPATDEGRWRLQQVHRDIAELQDLPSAVARLPWGVMCWKLDELHRRHPGATVTALRRALCSTFQRVRQRAVELSGRLPCATRVDLLLEMEHDPSPWVRQSVYESLAAVAPARLRQLLQRTLDRHESAALTREAVLGARRVGVSDALATRIEDRWRRQDRALRIAIAEVLLTAAPQRIDRTIVHWALSEGGNELTRLALTRVEQEPQARDVAPVLGLFESGEPGLRGRAAAWLAAHGGQGHAARLAALVDSPDRELARLSLGVLVAWNALDAIGDVEAVLTRIEAPREWLRLPGHWVPATAQENAAGVRPAVQDGANKTP